MQWAGSDQRGRMLADRHFDGLSCLTLQRQQTQQHGAGAEGQGTATCVAGPRLDTLPGSSSWPLPGYDQGRQVW